MEVIDKDYFADDEDARSACVEGILRTRRLRWGADRDAATRVGCKGNHKHEDKGSWEATGLPKAASRAEARNATITFYETGSGKPLFVAPRNRTMEAFLQESRSLGWLSFRDAELVVANVRALRGTGGQMVSVDGMRLGVNRPDESASRYAISLVTIAGQPPSAVASWRSHDEVRK